MVAWAEWTQWLHAIDQEIEVAKDKDSAFLIGLDLSPPAVSGSLTRTRGSS